jgi:putative heme-binding domain-containing protein
MYRGLIEGVQFLPPEFMKYLNPIGGNDRGRIYRIAPQGFRQPVPPNLGDASTEELVALLDHQNGWHRDTASRLLYQRQDRNAIVLLQKLVASAKTPAGRMTALYSLRGLDALDENTVLAALSDRSPLVRIHALRLAEPFAIDSPAVGATLCSMIMDNELRVRYQLAFSLGAASGHERNLALANLIVRDGEESWMRLAVMTSLNQGAGQVFTHLRNNEEFRKTSHGNELLLSLAEQIGTANRTNEIAAVIKTLQDLPSSEKLFAQRLVQALVKKQQAGDRRKTLSAANGKAGEILAELLREAKLNASDEKKPIAQRVEAIRSLKLSPFAEIEKLFGDLLDLQQPSEVQRAVLATLSDFSNDRVAEIVLQQWRGFSPAVRAEATETLLSRSTWITGFLQALENGNIRRGDVDAARIALLKKHPDAKTARRAALLFGTTSSDRLGEIIAKYQSALRTEGDANRGKQIFKKVCSACHQLEGVGTAIGADLRAIRNRGMSAVMLNILDPNREMKPKFMTYVLTTEEGKVITGMIEVESANSMTIRRPDGTKVDVQRTEIEELSSTGLSFMPEGFEKQVDIKSMADLLAYFDSIR